MTKKKQSAEAAVRDIRRRTRRKFCSQSHRQTQCCAAGTISWTVWRRSIANTACPTWIASLSTSAVDPYGPSRNGGRR